MNSIFRSYPLVVLILQNLIIFFRHYFMGAGFPWDFSMAYYAMTAFWTTAIRFGTFPHWVPFQSMGYPFGMNLQSGIYYPPLWIFPIFNIQYTLQNAVRLECLHVLLGCIGMFLFLKIIFEAKYALVGSIAFQFFGGFYSNSQHVDIIRAYALAPWLFYACTLNYYGQPRLLFRNLLIPPLVYLLATGGYPGNFLSSIFILSIYILLQFNSDLIYKKFKTKSKAAARIIIIFALIILGICMASVHLGPAWLYGKELTRYETSYALEKMGLWLEHIPGLFLSSRKLPGEISMTSTYITLPIFFFLFFISNQEMRKKLIYIIILCLSLTMVAGEKSVIWLFISKLFPPLGLSRFPSSDYRVFIAIMTITLSIYGLKNILNPAKVNYLYKRVFIACMITLSGLYFGIHVVNIVPLIDSPIKQEFIEKIQEPIAYIIIILLVIVLSVAQSQKNRLRRQKIIIIIALLTIIDGVRVTSDMLPMWFVENAEVKYVGAFSLMDNNNVLPKKIFKNLPVSRPVRQTTDHYLHFSWKGYLNGSFMMQDYGGTVLKNRKIIEENEVYKNYMMMSWKPIFLEPALTQHKEKLIDVTDENIRNIIKQDSWIPGKKVIQKSYGVNNITYQVSMERESVMMENETYFPGWSAILTAADNKKILLKSIPINKAFRGWLLPPGNYEMKASFEMPYWEEFRNFSIFCFLIWLTFVLCFFKNILIDFSLTIHEKNPLKINKNQ